MGANGLLRAPDGGGTLRARAPILPSTGDRPGAGNARPAGAAPARPRRSLWDRAVGGCPQADRGPDRRHGPVGGHAGPGPARRPHRLHRRLGRTVALRRRTVRSCHRRARLPLVRPRAVPGRGPPPPPPRRLAGDLQQRLPRPDGGEPGIRGVVARPLPDALPHPTAQQPALHGRRGRGTRLPFRRAGAVREPGRILGRRTGPLSYDAEQCDRGGRGGGKSARTRSTPGWSMRSPRSSPRHAGRSRSATPSGTSSGRRTRGREAYSPVRRRRSSARWPA